ncbi:VOC family protein [Paenibacillus xylaniclasticus]|uniref:VOC family protein n=1 Tax=Paenibacillus xylaniclasticus TaxID=588083 RepID=UPI000FDB2F74|nr:VOC family protein [Paenibacillus xylaniclasticus]
MAVVTTNYAVIKVPVKDLEASVRWYQDVIGIPFGFDFTPGDNEAWLDVGGVGLGLIRCPDVPKLEFRGIDGRIHPIIQFQVQDIHSVYEEIKGKGIEVSEMYYLPSGGYSFELRDPDGHLTSLWGGWPSAEDEAANT